MKVFLFFIGVFIGVMVGYRRRQQMATHILPLSPQQPRWNTGTIQTLLNEHHYRRLDLSERIGLAQQLALDIITPYQTEKESAKARDLLTGALIGIEMGHSSNGVSHETTRNDSAAAAQDSQ